MTTHLRRFTPERDWPCIKGQTGAILCYDTEGVVAENAEDGEMYGAIIFDNFSPRSAQAHVCILNPVRALRAQLIQAAAHYVFIERDRKVLFGLVPSSNHRAKRFDEHIGWKEVARLNEAFDEGVDYIIYEIKREDCRWIDQTLIQEKVKYG